MEKFKLNRLQTIGLFVLLTLIATFVLINFLKGQDIFKSNNTYYTEYESVEGLTVTGPVFIRGLKVGKVDAIEYEAGKDRFIVEYSVKSDFRIPSNSVAEIFSSDIMGSRALRLSFGDAKDFAESGDTFEGKIVPDMVSMLMSEIGPLKDGAVTLMGNMDKTLDSVNALLDSSSRADLKHTFASLNATMANAAAISKALKNVSPELQGIMENLRVLSEGLSAGSGDLQGTLANVNEITSSLSKARLDETIASLTSLMNRLQDPSGTVGKLLTTDSLHTAVNNLINDVDNLVECIKEKPKKYIKISVF